MPLKKLYLDTSIISHLDALDAQDKMRDTKKLWEYFIDSNYEIFLSNVIFDEIMECADPNKTLMLNQIKKIKYSLINENEQSKLLVKEYLKCGVLTEKNIDDLRHVSLAVIFNCDYILSWNFKHLVNIRTIDKIKGINKLLGYKDINIIPPTMLIEEDDIVYDANIEYIHQIRYNHYEETKHMSLQEIIEQSNERAKKIIEELDKIKND
ncbi:PIN domain nuclease [Mycoplasmatota bacterium]|nr:PIN domain nuclease [Mycoplasmatota bacterium]